MACVVLVTGAGRPFGGRVAARLAAEPGIDRVIAVDTVPPPDPGSFGCAEFVRADIGHPLIGKVLDQARVDTVVHTCGSHRDEHLATTMLLAACERSRTLTRLVAESSTAVYAGARRAVCDETAPTTDDDLESLVRGFARSREDVTVTVLRLAELVGAGFDSPLRRWLTDSVAPVVAGFDPCLQLLHVDDALEVLVQACVERHPGAVNVAAADVLTLAQLARRAGRVRAPVPPRLAGAEAARLAASRVVDTTRLGVRFGFVPQYSSAEALETVTGRVPSRALVPALVLTAVGTAERMLAAAGRSS